MLFFKDELEIKEKILANRSISYLSQVLPYNPQDKQKENIIERVKSNLSLNRTKSPFWETLEKAFANLSDRDLYYSKSILVTSCWNLNDDVFTPLEVWAARNTPINKPTNLTHDEHQIVGHITEVWPISDEGVLLDDSLSADEIPEYYHLLNGSVIYKSWSDEKLVERTQTLIDEIEAGTKFVSMEAHFTGFDYAVKSAKGEFNVVARDKTSAFLTKHLRVYGGQGEYDGYKVGRLLRGITFAGKGYVDNPGNPDSVIFNSATNFKFSVASVRDKIIINKENGVVKNVGVYPTREKTVSENKMEETIKELKAELKASQDKIQSLAAEAKKAAEDKVAAETAKLQAEVEAAKKTADEMKKMRDEMKAKSDTSEADLVKAKTEFENLSKASKELTEKLAKIEAEKVEADRVAKLVEAGLTKEDASAKVKTFANLNDEQFAALAAVLTVKKPEEKKETEAEKAAAAKLALDKAKETKDSTTAGLGARQADTKVEDLRKAIAERMKTVTPEKKSRLKK